jgi:enoyl-CoA hydratase/carnithine racemase
VAALRAERRINGDFMVGGAFGRADLAAVRPRFAFPAAGIMLRSPSGSEDAAMSQAQAEVLYEVDDPVAIIRLNRPEKLNAFTYHTLAELRSAVDRANRDPAVVGIVITGEGRAFCAGLDTRTLEESARGGPRAAADPDAIPGLFSYLLDIDKPVIGAINGPAAGGGFVLACLCDVRFASPSAVFITSFSQRGLVSEHGTSWIVPRLVGVGWALDLLWTSRKLTAQKAAEIGLVQHLTGEHDLLQQATDYVRLLAATVSPMAMRDIKKLVYAHSGIHYEPALREADRVTVEALNRDDAVEGVRSFVERRQPRFKRIGEAQDQDAEDHH